MERKYLTDDELAEYFGVCKNTARKIAEEADAVRYITKKAKRNNVEKINHYVESHGTVVTDI